MVFIPPNDLVTAENETQGLQRNGICVGVVLLDVSDTLSRSMVWGRGKRVTGKSVCLNTQSKLIAQGRAQGQHVVFPGRDSKRLSLQPVFWSMQLNS